MRTSMKSCICTLELEGYIFKTQWAHDQGQWPNSVIQGLCDFQVEDWKKILVIKKDQYRFRELVR